MRLASAVALHTPPCCPRPLCTAVRPDGSVLARWEVDASDALPAALPAGLQK